MPPRPAGLVLSAVLLGGAGPVRAQDEEVVVTRPRSDEAPAGTTSVDPAEVARPGDGVEDVLATVPGVRIQRLGGLGAFAGVSLRGSGFRQTLVRLDGVALNPDGVEAVDLSRWPLAGLARVEVTRGRPSATVGAAPIGGVVDLWTGDGVQPPVAEVAGGSFGSVRASASAGGVHGASDGLIAADVLQTVGRFRYVDDGGTLYDPADDAVRVREDNARTQVGALLRGRVGTDRARMTTLVSLAHRVEGLPGPIGRPTDGASLRTDRVLASVGGEGALGVGRMTGRLWGLWRAQQLADPAGAFGGAPRRQRDRFGTLGATWTGRGAVHRRVGLRGSVDARVEGFTRREGDDQAPGRQAGRWGLGAAIDAPIRPVDQLEIVPGVDLRVLAPWDDLSAGVVAGLPGLVVRGSPSPGVDLWASGTGAFRPPDLTELFGDQGALRGNPDLRPERAWKAEAGVRADGATTEGVSWGVEAAAFGTWATDAIGWLQNTQRTLVAVNFGRTRTVGGELGLGLAWRDRVGLRLSGTLLDARQTTADPTRQGRPVPFAAPGRVWARGWTAPWAPLRLGVDVDATSSVPVDAQGVTREPQRVLLGAFVSLAVARSPWTLSIDVRNLLGQRTGPLDRDPLGPDDTTVEVPITDLVGYPLPGRTVWVAVRWTPGRAE